MFTDLDIFFSVLSNPHGGGGSSSSNHSVSSPNYDICGANFCVTNLNNNENLQRPANSEIYEISGIYLACIVVAVFIIAFLVDPLSRLVHNISLVTNKNK